MISLPVNGSKDGPYRFAVLVPDPRAPRAARSVAASALRSWELTHLRDDVELVVSELVTNALRLGTPVAVLVMLHPGTDEIEVAVWDDGPGLPERRPQDEAAESGRGLLLVEARSNAWGWRRGGHGTGKVTWATLGPKPRDDDDLAS